MKQAHHFSSLRRARTPKQELALVELRAFMNAKKDDRKKAVKRARKAWRKQREKLDRSMTAIKGAKRA